MSRRFGRNQRRRAREEIARLGSEALNFQQAYFRDIEVFSRRNTFLENQIERLKKLLGQNFVGFNAKEMKCNSVDEYIKLRVRCQQPSHQIYSTPHTPPQACIYDTFDLDKFIFFLEKDLTPFKDCSRNIHFILRGTNGIRCGYAFSYELFEDLNREEIIRILAENFALVIADYMEKEKLKIV